MPGYYLHFLACNDQARENLSFMRGVEAPDILKKHFKLYGYEGARDKYESLKTSDMPDYSKFEDRVSQKESAKNTDGLHYGISSNPGVLECWNSLSEEEKQNPFYRGYIWHLITDAIMYAKLDIDSKFMKFIELNKDNPNFDELKKEEVKKLHADWDKTNAKVRDTYPDVVLPEEVIELGVVQFIEDENMCYVEWETLKNTIDFLRGFDSLYGDMDEIIKEVMDNI